MCCQQQKGGGEGGEDVNVLEEEQYEITGTESRIIHAVTWVIPSYPMIFQFLLQKSIQQYIPHYENVYLHLCTPKIARKHKK